MAAKKKCDGKKCEKKKVTKKAKAKSPKCKTTRVMKIWATLDRDGEVVAIHASREEAREYTYHNETYGTISGTFKCQGKGRSSF